MNDLDKVLKIINKVDRNKSKMTGQQYMDLMVCLKGLEANLENGASFKKQLKPTGKCCQAGELKVGDKVRITTMDDPPNRPNLRWNDINPKYDYNQYKGKITEVLEIDEANDTVTLAINKNVFRFCWLEKVA